MILYPEETLNITNINIIFKSSQFRYKKINVWWSHISPTDFSFNLFGEKISLNKSNKKCIPKVKGNNVSEAEISLARTKNIQKR